MERTLILMRHGHHEASQAGLSPFGQQQVTSVAEQIMGSGVLPEVILYSPAQRTVETAERVSDVFGRLGHKPVLRQVEWLAENSSASPLIELLKTPDDLQRLMFVTHQPPIYGLTSMFLDPQKPGHAQAFAYKSDSWKGYLSPTPFKQWAP